MFACTRGILNSLLIALDVAKYFFCKVSEKYHATDYYAFTILGEIYPLSWLCLFLDLQNTSVISVKLLAYNMALPHTSTDNRSTHVDTHNDFFFLFFSISDKVRGSPVTCFKLLLGEKSSLTFKVHEMCLTDKRDMGNFKHSFI